MANHSPGRGASWAMATGVARGRQIASAARSQSRSVRRTVAGDAKPSGKRTRMAPRASRTTCQFVITKPWVSLTATNVPVPREAPFKSRAMIRATAGWGGSGGAVTLHGQATTMPNRLVVHAKNAIALGIIRVLRRRKRTGRTSRSRCVEMRSKRSYRIWHRAAGPVYAGIGDGCGGGLKARKHAGKRRTRLPVGMGDLARQTRVCRLMRVNRACMPPKTTRQGVQSLRHPCSSTAVSGGREIPFVAGEAYAASSSSFRPSKAISRKFPGAMSQWEPPKILRRAS